MVRRSQIQVTSEFFVVLFVCKTTPSTLLGSGTSFGSERAVRRNTVLAVVYISCGSQTYLRCK